MRLWHPDLIPLLPRQYIIHQHRDCAALRGRGWGRKHAPVDYVFRYSWEHLYTYHQKVIQDMEHRGYKPNPVWKQYHYRGRFCGSLPPDMVYRSRRLPGYPEHTPAYLHKCIEILMGKLSTAPPGRFDENEVYRFYLHATDLGIQTP